MRRKNSKLIYILLFLLFVSGGLAYYYLNNQNQFNPTISQENIQTPNSNVEKIVGIAYMSPNPGEGISIQYSETINGHTSNPFIPLKIFIDSNTKIANINDKGMQLSDIKVGDNLIVYRSRPIGIMAVRGEKGGIIMHIYSIQDLSR